MNALYGYLIDPFASFGFMRTALVACLALALANGPLGTLLLLRRGKHPSYAQPDDLTPYWTPIAPTNEQLFDGASDAWFVWVSRQLRRRSGA